MTLREPGYTLITGDCIDAMRAMQAGSVDAVVTDVPYNEVNRESNGLRSFDKGEADSSPFDAAVFVNEAVRVCAGSFYVFCGWGQISALTGLFAAARTSVRLGFWHKSNPTVANGEHLWLSAVEPCVYAKKPRAYFDRHCKAPVWFGPTDSEIDWHPTPKPVWLMRELVTASVPVGGIVLDPYCGSAPVGVAALSEGRHFIGIDVNAGHTERAARRLADVNLDLFHGAA